MTGLQGVAVLHIGAAETREVKEHAQSHTAGKQMTRGLNADPVFLTILSCQDDITPCRWPSAGPGTVPGILGIVTPSLL